MTRIEFMDAISISNLKTHLSATLKKVINGVNYTVMDRENPVAALIPFVNKKTLIIQRPTKTSKIKNSFKGKINFDPVNYLLEDRNGNRF